MFRLTLLLTKRFLPASLLLCLTLSAIGARADGGSTETLIVQGNKAFPPYEFVNKKGEPAGFNVELINTIADRLAMDVDIVLDDWEKAPEALASGKADLITAMVLSEQRERQFDFTMAHAGIFYCLFVRRDSPIKSIKDAKQKEILVQAGVYAHEWLQSRDITDKIVPLSTPREVLDQLAGGRGDGAIIERLSGLMLMDAFKVNNVVLTGPPLFCAPYAFAVRKGNDRLLTKLDEGIHLLHQDGTYDDLYRKWFSIADIHARRTALLRYSLFILGVIAVLLVGVLAWNFVLKRLVRQRTAQLAKSEKRFQELSDLLPQTVFEADAGGRLTFLNRSGFEMLGLDRDRPLGSFSLSNFIPEMTGKDDWLDSGAQCGKTCRARGLAMNTFPALLYVSPVRSDTRQVGWRGILVDITFQKELEKQIVEAQKMEAIGRLAGGVAHDFNNIITGIHAYAYVVKRNPQDVAVVTDGAEKILMGCNRAGDLVRHFLATAGRRKAEKQAVRLKGVVDEVFKLLQPTYHSVAKLDNRITENGDTVWGEPVLVFQVLMNLCVNGVQAMGDKGGTLTVGLGGEPVQADDGGHPSREIFVSDQGPGIDPEIRDRIFDPFFTTKQAGKGTGIGLFVVSQSLATMGGTIRVESQPGNGATFIVSMPSAPLNAQIAA